MKIKPLLNFLFLFMACSNVSLAQVMVSTFAGNGSLGSADGNGTAASFQKPQGITMDANGNLFVMELFSSIRKITPQRDVTTLNSLSFAGYQDGPLDEALFTYPYGITADQAGNLYIADMGNVAIRKVSSQGIVSTFAGSIKGYADGNGNSAKFDDPYGVAVDAAGNVYVADMMNNRIRKITPQGVVSTLAGSTAGFADGNGINAKFRYPYAVATDAAGNVYVADRGNNRIRKITPQGDVTTLSGSTQGFADGNGASAKFNLPNGIAVDAAGNVYVTDSGNSKIRKVTPQGDVFTVAGSTYGFADGAGANAKFSEPGGLVIDAQGNLYVSDINNNSIRKITYVAPSVPTGLTVTAGDAKADLSWAAVSTATKYKVYRGTSATALTELTTVTSGTSYTDNTALNGNTYYYAVSAVDNINGESVKSAVKSAALLLPPTIVQPADISLSIDQNTYTITVPQSNSDGAFSYVSSNPSVASVNGNILTLLTVGQTTITASQAASPAYSSGSTSFTLTLNSLPQPNMGAFNLNDATYGDGQLILTAPASNSSGQFTFTSSNTSVASVSGNTLSVLKPGTITVTAMQASDGIYSAGSTNTTFTILPKLLTASFAAVVKEYDGNAAVTVGFRPLTAENGLIASDEVQVSYTAAAFSNADAGYDKEVTLTGLMLSGPDKENYTLHPVSVSGNITPKPVTAKAAPLTRIYDGTTNASVSFIPFDAENGLAGNDDLGISYSSASFADANAGQDKLISFTALTLTGEAKNNYTLTAPVVKGSITSKPVTVKAVASHKTYGTQDPDFGYTVTPDMITGDSLTGSLSRSAGEGTGTYPIARGSLAANANYTVTFQPADFTITRAALTITADNQSKTMGLPNPLLTASYNGLAYGDGNSIVSSQVNISTSVNAATGIGDYPIVVTGPATTSNYTITYVNGNFKVSPGAPKTITLNVRPFIYENQPAGTLAGTLSSTSDDPNAVFTYSLVSGSADNGFFTISDNILKTTRPFDFESKPLYHVVIRSTTQYGFSLDKEFTLAIADINEAPGFEEIGNQVVCASSGEHTVMLKGVSAGPETSQSVSIYVSASDQRQFDKLAVNYSGGNSGFLTYQLKDGFAGAVTIELTLKDDGGVENEGADTYKSGFTITANPLPVVSIASDMGTSISKGNTIHLVAAGGVSYKWEDAEGIISSQTSSNLTVRPSKNTKYKVTVTNESGCSVEKEINITVIEDYLTLQCSNIISANGDGVNDNFVIKNIDMYPDNTLRIYDRAGRLVYNKMNYNNDWNGAFNGLPLTTDSYYYILTFKNGKRALKGPITIIP